MRYFKNQHNQFLIYYFQKLKITALKTLPVIRQTDCALCIKWIACPLKFASINMILQLDID